MKQARSHHQIINKIAVDKGISKKKANSIVNHFYFELKSYCSEYPVRLDKNFRIPYFGKIIPRIELLCECHGRSVFVNKGNKKVCEVTRKPCVTIRTREIQHRIKEKERKSNDREH